jgi:hypothetical protein
LSAFNSRARMAKDMLSTLRRRTVLPAIEITMGGRTKDDSLLCIKPSTGDDEVERHMRRRSSPAELPRRERSGFSHPVLALPGAF